jgi:hypothetical protein
MTKRVMRFPITSPRLVTKGEIAHSDSEKAEALADSLETQFLPVTDPSLPSVIEIVGVALKSFFLTPASYRNLTNPDEIQEAIMAVEVSKALEPNCIPHRDLKHLPQPVVSPWPGFSIRFSSPITSPQHGSTLV